METTRFGVTITVEYEYDDEGNRVRKVLDGTVVINYLVDTNRDYAQVLEERDGSGTLLVRYVYGHDLISQTRDGATSYYHYDGLGSTRALTASSEAITDTYNYDAFGNLLDKTGTTTNTYLFTGEFFDANIGFYYLRARYMNPAIGRFVTMDTFAGMNRDPYSLHKYLYAHANPVNLVDPSGEAVTFNDVTIAGMIIGAMSGLYVYHVTHEPSERTLVGATTWTLGGSMIGGLLAYGASYIWLSEGSIITAAQEVLRDPKTIRFTQDSIKREFKNGKTLKETIEALKANPKLAEDFPAIRIFKGKGGEIFSLDNRRLFVFQEAGIKIRTVAATAEEIAKEAWKFTTKNGGISIRVRGGL